MTEPVSLDLHCPHCGGALTAEFADWDEAQDAPLVPAALCCPYCGQTHTAGFPARLLWVVRRPGSEPERPQSGALRPICWVHWPEWVN